MATLVLTATEDSWVNAGNSAANYGATNGVFVGLLDGSHRRGLFKFDLSSIPAGATVDSATLTLRQNATPEPGQVRVTVKQITAAWAESTVTWNNQPTTTDGGQVWKDLLPTNGQIDTFDVRDIAETWVEGTANHGVMLVPASLGDSRVEINYASSEYPTTTFRPTLTVEYTPNRPPNAPTLDVPSAVDRNVTNRFNLTPSDPDPGDTTSQTDWRYREIGAPTWTTVSKTSPTTYYDFAAGTFLGTDYEIQARTYDALGEVGPYSSSSFFTANDAPDQPTWTDPLNGRTIGTASYTGTISAPDVDESEWRLVADNAGVIDEATVLHGPVLKTTGDVRSHTFSGLTNGVTVWWQARTKFGGLWSQWAAVRTPVAYTPPPAPTVTPAVSNVDGAVSVTVSTPAPGAGEPTVEYVDLYVRDTTGADTYRPATGIRWAMFRVPNGVTIDWLAASGVNYEYQAVAHGDNGTTAASAWTAIDPDAVATIYFGGSFD